MKLRPKDGCEWVAGPEREILIESESAPDAKYLGSWFRSETTFQNVKKHKKMLVNTINVDKNIHSNGHCPIGTIGWVGPSPRPECLEHFREGVKKRVYFTVSKG